MARTPQEAVVSQPEQWFDWKWFLGWTALSAFLIFAALSALVGRTPPQPFLVSRLAEPDPAFGQLILLLTIAATISFFLYFLVLATVPGIGPHTRPAGRWVIVALALALGVGALWTAGSISSAQPFKAPALTSERLYALLKEVQNISVPNLSLNLSHEALSAILLVCLIFAVSTASVISNLATSLRDCTDEQKDKIRSFLLWMHGFLALIVLFYSFLLFRTNIRIEGFKDGQFILYFLLFYVMVSVLIFAIPAALFSVLTIRTTFASLTGFTIPTWASSLLSKLGLDGDTGWIATIVSKF
jgi:hypothetical protein